MTLDGVAVKPALALGSWVAFTGNGDHVAVMGDLVLTENEIAPVMKQLVQDGLEVMAFITISSGLARNAVHAY